MLFKTFVSLALAVISAAVAAAEDRFAGNGAHMSREDWLSDLAMAKAAKIDGFAMNIAAGDPNTDAVLAAAYSAAEAVGDFKMFLSFDYLSMGAWGIDQVISKINQYKSSPAQFRYNGKPLVSTFEGVSNIGDWSGIKSATGCFFIPDWSSLGPAGFASHLYTADGAFSWDAWPEGAEDKTTEADEQWTRMLSGKPFMMPVSPWFYTNMPNWNKNWLWRGDNLWHDRWQQVIRLQPAMVQILSWNDFGESSYIGPIHDSAVPEGADYVVDMPHEAWLKFLPYYIDTYKTGSSTTPTFNSLVASPEEGITFWYKRNPGKSGGNGGTTGNSPAQGQPATAPELVLQDKIFASVLVAEPSDVIVSIGGAGTSLRATRSGINHFSVTLDGRTGVVDFTIQRNGRDIISATGPEITNSCKNGLVNWNAFVGSS